MSVEVLVLIVGAGPAGLAVAAALAVVSVPSLILERDDCIASSWRKRTYDRLHLHLPKQYCELPHFPHPSTFPTFAPKADFLRYLDDYAARFDIAVRFRREVRSARFDEGVGKWRVSAINVEEEESEEEYLARYLVVASGRNDVPYVPNISGMCTFSGQVMHSSRYRSGSEFEGKKVLVVGSGNSGMEIAYDLWSFGATPSIVIRSPLHLVSKEIWQFAMFMMRYLPFGFLDPLVLFLCKLWFGDTSKHGIHRPTKGPFYLKKNTSVYPVVDIGTFDKIKTGEIQVLRSITNVKGDAVTFSDGNTHHFDVIILATGFRSMIKNWLKGDDNLIDENGMCKQKFPSHWKGKKGLYCAGLAWRGIYGIGEDALNIANDIKLHMV